MDTNVTTSGMAWASTATMAWGPQIRLPRLLAALTCEDAATSGGLADGRVTLQRVFFDLYAARFPAAFDRMVVVCFWTGGEGTHTVTVSLKAPDGAVVGRGEAALECRPEPATVAQIVYFPNLALPAPGKYTVEVALNSAPVHTFAVHVVQTQTGDAPTDA